MKNRRETASEYSEGECDLIVLMITLTILHFHPLINQDGNVIPLLEDRKPLSSDFNQLTKYLKYFPSFLS